MTALQHIRHRMSPHSTPYVIHTELPWSRDLLPSSKALLQALCHLEVSCLRRLVGLQVWRAASLFSLRWERPTKPSCCMFKKARPTSKSKAYILAYWTQGNSSCHLNTVLGYSLGTPRVYTTAPAITLCFRSSAQHFALFYGVCQA